MDIVSETSARAFARAMAGFWEDRLGPQLLGVYLIGSLAHGGFNPRYSDIDMAVIAEAGIEPAAHPPMRARAEALSPAHAAKLSLFWADRGFTIGRFLPLDRIDYLDHAAPLVERERVRPPRPPLADIRNYLRGQPFASWAEGARSFAALAALGPDDHKPYVRALLYPARFVYSWRTGTMGSNDAAVRLVQEDPPAGLDVGLIARALACRQAAQDPDALFTARGTLLRQIAACAALMAETG